MNNNKTFNEPGLDPTEPIVFEVPTPKNHPAYRVKVKKGEDGWLVVTSDEPALQGLVTQGKDEQEAVINAYDAAKLLLEDQGIFRGFYLYTGEE